MKPNSYTFKHYKRQINELKKRKQKEEKITDVYKGKIKDQNPLEPLEETLVFKKGYEKVKFNE